MESDNLLSTPMKPGAGIKLLLTSLLGIAIFFIPVELGGRSTIVVDHLAGLVMTQRPLATGLILLLIGYGAVMPLLDGRWRARPIDRILSLFKLLGLGVALIYVTGIGRRCSCRPSCSRMQICWCAMSRPWSRSARCSFSRPPSPAS